MSSAAATEEATGVGAEKGVAEREGVEMGTAEVVRVVPQEARVAAVRVTVAAVRVLEAEAKALVGEATEREAEVV